MLDTIVFLLRLRLTEALQLAQGGSARLGMAVYVETHSITFPITLICKH